MILKSLAKIIFKAALTQAFKALFYLKNKVLQLLLIVKTPFQTCLKHEMIPLHTYMVFYYKFHGVS